MSIDLMKLLQQTQMGNTALPQSTDTSGIMGQALPSMLDRPAGFNVQQGQEGQGFLSQITPDHIMMLMMMLPQMLQAFGVGGTKPIESWGGKTRTVTSPTDITYSK